MKPVHMARLFNQRGGVSPVCAARPRAIDLKRATWTLGWHRVTCKKCLKRKEEIDGKENDPVPCLPL